MRSGEDSANMHAESNEGLEISELDELFGTVQDTITNLMRMSILIREATPRDRYPKAEKLSGGQFLASFDIDHVGNKFPKISGREQVWLKERLGKAITQRRQFLKYCRDHRDKLGAEDEGMEQSQGLALEFSVLHSSDHTTNRASRTASIDTGVHGGTFASTQASTLHLSQIDLTEGLREIVPDNSSQISYATSFGGDSFENSIEAPSLKDTTKIIPFECPYCWGLQDIRDEKV